MSNPYSSPETISAIPGKPVGGEKKVPGALTAITIICLVLGILGLLGFCGNVFAIGMQTFSATMIEQMPEDDPNTKFQKANLEFQQSMMIPMIFIAVFGLISSSGLVIGSIGALKRKSSMHGLFKNSLYIAAAFALVNTAWGCWATYAQMGGLDLLAAEGAPQETLEALKTGIFVALIVGMVFALLWGLGWMGFYLWSASYINRPSVKAYFDKP